MARTLRNYWKGKRIIRDCDQSRQSKPKAKRRERKQFMYRGDGWSCIARGGIGNKAGWGSCAATKQRISKLKYQDDGRK